MPISDAIFALFIKIKFLTMKKIAFFLTFVLLNQVLFAQDKRYFIIFSARDMHIKPFSIGGHAFVTWATQKNSTDTLFSHQTLGFYPEPASNVFNATFKKIKGRVMKGFDYNRKGMELEQLIVEVDSSSWQRSQKVEKGWAKHRYNLLRSNCVNFIDRVAGSAKLKRIKTVRLSFIPVRPVKYIREMIKKNERKVWSNEGITIVEENN